MSTSKNPDNPIKTFRVFDCGGRRHVFHRDGKQMIDVWELSLGFDVICEVMEFEDEKKYVQVCS